MRVSVQMSFHGFFLLDTVDGVFSFVSVLICPRMEKLKGFKKITGLHKTELDDVMFKLT